MKTKRIVGGMAIVLVAAAVAFIIFALPGYREQGRIGAAYAARVACSCRYVAGRTLSNCRKDFEPGMSPITMSEDRAAKRITARYPMLAKASARFEEGWGCRVETGRQ